MNVTVHQAAFCLFVLGAGVLSALDLLYRRVPVWTLLLESVPALVLFVEKTGAEKFLALVYLLVLCPVATAGIWRHKAGGADLWGLALVCLALESSRLTGCLLISFLLAGAAAGQLLILRRFSPPKDFPASREMSIPFLPFLLTGILWSLWKG